MTATESRRKERILFKRKVFQAWKAHKTVIQTVKETGDNYPRVYSYFRKFDKEGKDFRELGFA